MMQRSVLGRWWSVLGGFILVGAVVLVVGVSSAAAGGGAPGATAAAALVKKAAIPPKFTGPTKPIDAAALKGKTVWIIDNSLQNPFNTQLADSSIAALQKVGIKTKLIDGKGETTEWERDIDLAASQKPAGVIGSGLTTTFLKGPLKQLAAAKVPFVDDLLDKDVPEPKGVSAKVGVDNNYSGSVAAAVAVATMKTSSPGVLILDDSEFATSVGIYVNAAKSYLHKNCPDCQVIVKDELFATAATNIPGDVQDTLRANPGIKWIICGYDAQAGFAVQGLQEGGITGVRVVASGGSTPQLNQLRKGGGPYVSDQLVSGIWAGWAGADEIMRRMLKEPTPTEVLPFRLLSHSDMASTNNPVKLMGTNFETPYLKLWGLKK